MPQENTNEIPDHDESENEYAKTPNHWSETAEQMNEDQKATLEIEREKLGTIVIYEESKDEQ